MRFRKTLGEEMKQYFRSDEEDFPSFVRFATSRGMSPEELEEMRKKHPSFAEAYRECEQILCDRVVYGALHKRFDASFSKFYLACKFGWSDKEKEEDAEDFTLKIHVLDEGDS